MRKVFFFELLSWQFNEKSEMSSLFDQLVLAHAIFGKVKSGSSPDDISLLCPAKSYLIPLIGHTSPPLQEKHAPFFL